MPGGRYFVVFLKEKEYTKSALTGRIFFISILLLFLHMTNILKKPPEVAVVGNGPAAGAIASFCAQKIFLNSQNVPVPYFLGTNFFQLPKWDIPGNSRKYEDIIGPYLRDFISDELRATIEFQKAQEGDGYLSLCDAFAVVEKILEEAKKILGDECFSENTIVQRIVLPKNETSPFQLYDTNEKEHLSASTILATGAEQKISENLKPYRKKLILSEPLLRAGGEQQILDALRADPETKITIVGGSHSAFSVLLKIQRAIESGKIPPPQNPITVLHNSPIKIFYENTQEAQGAGYEYSSDDVCPQTRRVHRFGGLRSEAGEIAKKALRDEIPWITLQKSTSDSKEYNSTLEHADILIQAYGEQTRLPEILDSKGNPINVAQKRGLVDVQTETRLLLLESGVPINGLYGLGFGFGIKPGTIGEKNFGGKVVTINEYAQFGVEAIFKNLSQRIAL